MRGPARGVRRIPGRRVLLSGDGSAGGPRAQLRWRSDDEFTIDGVEYACRPYRGERDSSADRFSIRKPREAVERYAERLGRLRPRSIMEVGVLDGGSTAFMAQVARPERLIAIDIESAREGLERFIDAEGLRDSVEVHWEVDQGDGMRLREITASGFEGPIDLVVDDASHLLGPSRATFNALFPMLRPGGEYLLEDWSWAHAAISVWPNRPPLTLMVFELVIACAHRPELIARVEVDGDWTVVTRGEATIEPEGFDLADHCGQRGLEMLKAMTP